jgi:uncharacterized paraquat-inducible protein A
MARPDEPKALLIAGQRYERVPHGAEDDREAAFANCPDCGVERGAIHLQHCDQERCPRCVGQLISCACDPIEDCW